MRSSGRRRSSASNTGATSTTCRVAPETRSAGANKPAAGGLFKTWPDPLQPSNVVFGTRQSSGNPDGNNPRIGTFSTLTTKKFDAKGRFEYSGRLLRTNVDSRIGLTFLSAYPEIDKYYLIGL